jgi:maleylpyruvate isomerase
MTTSSHLADNLTLLAHETSLLMRTAAGLDDESIRVPSLCEGWTRAHVLTHIARNADALGNLVSWAVTGTPRAMYDSPEARDADIAAGSTRGPRRSSPTSEDSAARFAAAAPVWPGAPEQVEVEMRGGHKVLGGQLPTLRLMEVVFHHVRPASPATRSPTPTRGSSAGNDHRRRAVQRQGPGPSVTLRSDEGRRRGRSVTAPRRSPGATPHCCSGWQEAMAPGSPVRTPFPGCHAWG